MNHEQKAKELIDKFRKLTRISGASGTSIEASKQCALICVKEIIESYPTNVSTFNSSKGLHVVHEDNRNY